MTSTEYTSIHMTVHGARGVTLLSHSQLNGTEWAEIKIGHLRITVFERAAIDDALHLPRDEAFTSNIVTDEAA